MKEHDSRIAIRLPSKERKKIEHLMVEKKFKNLSQVVRQALKEFQASV